MTLSSLATPLPAMSAPSTDLIGEPTTPVRIRLVEIGEAVKGLELALLDREPGIPWRQIAGMRDRLVHGYFDTAYSIVENTAREDVPQLRKAAERLLAQLSEER